MTAFSGTYRFWEGVQNDPAIANAWGTPNSFNMSLVEAAVGGTGGSATVNIAGLTTYALTTANGATDQARPFLQQYTGALSATCTVTLPNLPRIMGWAQNLTSGGFNVVLSAGAGTTLTIPNDGRWYWYATDGATNVIQPTPAFGIALGPVAGTTGTFSGAITGAGYSGGPISGTTGTFSSTITGAGYSGGPISGTTGTFSSTITGTGYSGGPISGTTGTFSSTITGAGYSGGPIGGTTGTFTGAVSGTTGTFSSDVSGVNGIFSGNVSGVAGTFTGAVAGTTGTFSAGLLGTSGNLLFRNTTNSATFFTLKDANQSLTGASGSSLILVGTAWNEIFSQPNAGNALVINQAGSGNGTGININLNGLNSGNSSTFIVFESGGTGIGSITGSGNASTQYNTTCDQRLKIDDGGIEGLNAVYLLRKLKPHWFRWKTNPHAAMEPGFFAQQVNRVWPWAVRRGNRRSPWQMDNSKLMPLVVAALQAALNTIEDQNKRIKALERRI